MVPRRLQALVGQSITTKWARIVVGFDSDRRRRYFPSPVLTKRTQLLIYTISRLESQFHFPVSLRDTRISLASISGRSGASRPLSPLRTVRDSFPSHGSSISKASPGGARPLMKNLLHRLCDTYRQPQSLAGEGTHADRSRVHLLSFLDRVLPAFSQRDTRPTSAPFRAGQILNPYPPHYRIAFASSGISIPHPRQCGALRFTCLEDQAEIRSSHRMTPVPDRHTQLCDIVSQPSLRLSGPAELPKGIG